MSSEPAAATFPFSASGSLAIPRRLMGFAIVEVGGATAYVRIRDGTIAGPIILPVKLAAGESVGDISELGLELLNGAVYVEIVSGTVVGAIYGR